MPRDAPTASLSDQLQAVRHCEGCGAQLRPNNGPGARRKWCSERCRKGSYGDPCIGRDAPTSDPTAQEDWS